MPQKEEGQGNYTYEDYIAWSGDVRYELIDGFAYKLTSPTAAHQAVARELITQINMALKGKPYQVYHSLDVKLDITKGNNTVVQPDVFVVRNPSIIDPNGACNGVPDFVVEILSPLNGRHDTLVKYYKYLEAKVREYWIVDTVERLVRCYIYENGKYFSKIFADNETAAIESLDGVVLDLDEVFSVV
jgi:Uma2 family endonuclease